MDFFMLPILPEADSAGEILPYYQDYSPEDPPQIGLFLFLGIDSVD